jgi:hypothetical protein
MRKGGVLANRCRWLANATALVPGDAMSHRAMQGEAAT